MSRNKALNPDLAFTTEVWKPWIGVCAILVTVAVTVVVLNNKWESIPEVFVSLPAAALGSLIYLWILSSNLSFHILDDGLVFHADGRKLTWKEIRKAKRLPVPLFPFLLLYDEGNRSPTWLPLFLRDKKRFREWIRKHAKPDHPIVLALEKQRSS